MKRSPRLTQGFTRTLNPKLERFIRANPTAVELIRKKPSLGPQNGKWLKRASSIRAFCAHINHTLCKHPLSLGGPPAPFIAHTSAQYLVSTRPFYCNAHNTILGIAISCKG